MLHHAVQRGGQLVLLEIMLILPHADGARINLDQLGQGILHAAGNGYRAAQGYVEIGKLLRGQLAGGVHRRARLADDGIGDALRQAGQKRGDKLLALTRGRAVADGDGRHMMPRHHAADQLARLLLLAGLARQGKVSHARFQHLAVFIHHGQLAARAEARVHAQGHAPLDGRLHQKLLQVLREHADRAHVGAVGQLAAHLALKRRKNQTIPRILRRHGYLRGGQRTGAHIALGDHAVGRFIGRGEGYLQKAFFFAAIDGQHAVIRHARHALGVGVIHAVYAVLLLGGAGGQHAVAHQQPAQHLAQRRVIADGFGDDIPRAGQGAFRIGHILFIIYIGRGQRFQRALEGLLQKQCLRKAVQTALTGDGRARAALGTEGAVDILQFGQRGRGGQCCAQLVRQHLLLGKRLFYFHPALIQTAQVFQPLGQLAQQLIIQRACGLLAVTGDKGHGVACVQQLDHRANLLRAQRKLTG